MSKRREVPQIPVRRPGPGTPVTVVGLARSGAAAARWLLQTGCAVRVTERGRSPELEQAARALEEAGAGVELGAHTRGSVEGSQLVVASPGVPAEAPPLRWAREAGIPVVGELELGSWYCPGRIIAVTGSNGKSTVVTLVGEILKAAGHDTVVCGNIGAPLCGELGRIRPGTRVVLEVSSFQLEGSLAFRPEIACVLNVTDNHLDRHGSFARYLAAKERILAFQGPRGWAVLNAGDAGSRALRGRVEGSVALFGREESGAEACVSDGWLRLDLPGLSGVICREEALPARGPHHTENALAAAAITGLLGVEPAAIGRVLRTFKGLPHRQQWVGELRGVTFINDSKSTTVASGISAIQAAPGPVVLIAGGRDKGGDFGRLRPWREKLKAAVLIGEDGPKIASKLRGATRLERAGNLKEAVRTAFGLARGGECVLLSPMCTSFDMFRDFEERGERFTEEVRHLAAE